ncbi:MAG: DUF3078 domain-containing protein [Bacteroidota bacterium]
MKKILLILLTLLPLNLFGQAKDSVWKHSVVAGLNLTQVGYTDWAQGGENALAWTLGLDGRSTIDWTTWNFDNSYKFAFGQTRLGSQGLRKTDDKIDLASILTYKMGTYINPYIGATFKSQFATGYIYDNLGKDSAVSKFFDPGYFTESFGAGYQPVPEVKTRLGLALREIFTNTYTQYTDDPATPEIEKTKIDGGIEFVTDVNWQVMENLLFTSKFEMFAPMKQLDVVVVRGDNTLNAKVNKYVIVSFNVQLINEKAITPRTQLKEALSMGLTYSIY